MVVAALIVVGVFVGLGGLRLAGARRSQIKRGQVFALVLLGAAGLVVIRGALAIGGGLALAALLSWALSRASPSPAMAPPNQEDELARALLGLSGHPTKEQIRAAFRAKMAQAHPDRGGDPAHAARLSEARDRLLRASG